MLALPLPRWSVIRNRALARLGILPGAVPALTLPGLSCHVRVVLGKGDVLPARGLVGRVACLASRALAPCPVRGCVDEGTPAGAHHAPPLPVCGLGIPSRGLRTAPVAIGFARTLGVTVRGLNESARALRVAVGSVVTICSHAVPATSPVTVRGHRTGHFSPLTGPGHGGEGGGRGGVSVIVWSLMVPPRIAATLVCRWSLLLRVAPFLSPSLHCRTSPGCCSACRGPVHSGMQ